MSDEKIWNFGPGDGTIAVATGVTGPAARTGHRLTIEFQTWSGWARASDDVPVAFGATIVVDSLRVVSGQGGLTPLTPPEKVAARGNALKSLNALRHPDITFESSSVAITSDGYRALGTLTVNGRSRPHDLNFTVDGTGPRTIAATTTVSHRDFGLTPFSLMMGALKVDDEVRVDIGFAVA